MSAISLNSNIRATSNVGLFLTICASSLISQELPISYNNTNISHTQAGLSNHFDILNLKTIYVGSENASTLINSCVSKLLENSIDLDSDLVDLVNENFWSLV
jgi:hypothetical protein